MRPDEPDVGRRVLVWSVAPVERARGVEDDPGPVGRPSRLPVRRGCGLGQRGQAGAIRLHEPDVEGTVLLWSLAPIQCAVGPEDDPVPLPPPPTPPPLHPSR